MGPSLRVLLMACILASCTSEPTQLLLFIDTDIPVSELNRVFVQVTAPSEIGTETTMDVRREDLPLMVALQSEGNLDSEVVLNVIGRSGMTDLLTRRVRMQFVPNKTHFATVVLSDDCRTASLACDPTLTCDGGACKTDVLPTEEWRGIRPISVQAPDAGPMDGGTEGGTDTPIIDGGPDVPLVECPSECWAGCVTPGICDQVTDFALGGDHSCALTEAGRVFCWGRNNSGQLGHSININEATPRRVGGDLLEVVVTHIAAGLEHTCAGSGAQIWCWGSNENQALGKLDFAPTETATPTAIVSESFVGSTLVALEAGRQHTCASFQGAEKDGVYCWGSNSRNQVGRVSAVNNIPFGLQVLGFAGATTQLALGATHTCAIGTGMQVLCWGDGAIITQGGETPRPPMGPSLTAEVITAGASGTCSRGADQPWMCWGLKRDGTMLGFDPAILPPDIKIPEAVMPPGSIVPQGLVMGGTHACITDQDDQLHCYGVAPGLEPSGALSLYGSLLLPPVLPVFEVGGWAPTRGSSWIGGHTCAVVRDESAPLCWGNNQFDQTGQVSPDIRRDPTPVPRPTP